MKVKLKTRIKRAVVILVILAGVAISGVLIINQYVQSAGAKYIVMGSDVQKADAILVLGAFVSPSGAVSTMLYDRLKVGYELYKAGKADKIIVSGDHGQQDYDEVNAMKTYLIDKGVPAKDIFMDHAGFNTYDSIYRAKDIFQVKKVILVTQGYHLKRAVFVSRELGIEGYGVASDLRVYNVNMTAYHLRETAARNKDFFIAKFIKPEPTYLGEAIPITGDGRVTDDKTPVQSDKDSQELSPDKANGSKDTSGTKIVPGFQNAEIEGAMTALSTDGSTMILLTGYPEQFLKKIDLTSNQATEFYKSKTDWVILKVSVNKSGTKVFVFEGKKEKGYSPVPSYTEFTASVFDFTLGKVINLSGANYGWWNTESDVFYALSGATSMNMPSPLVNVMEYTSLDSSPRQVASFANVNLQIQATMGNLAYLVDNKGEGGVTLFRINLSSGVTENLGKAGRFLGLGVCVAFSKEGNYYFSFDESSERTMLTDLNKKGTKVVFPNLVNTKAIQWLPQEKQALLLISDPNGKGNGPSSIHLYSIASNITKKIYSFEKQVQTIVISPDSKKLYYVFDREGKKFTGVMSLEGML